MRFTALFLTLMAGASTVLAAPANNSPAQKRALVPLEARDQPVDARGITLDVKKRGIAQDVELDSRGITLDIKKRE
ncbi:hypothetical protein JCM8547_006403 [Rhodosporidiobolus lusitaniae]